MTITTDRMIIREEIPTWAMSMIINGDESGITEEDRVAVQAWVDFWAEKRAESWHVSVPNDAEPHFCNRPAIGLPCDCLTCEIVMMNVTIKR